jgi:hypothetical protein
MHGRVFYRLKICKILKCLPLSDMIELEKTNKTELIIDNNAATNKDCSLWDQASLLMDDLVSELEHTGMLRMILFRINTLLPVFSEDFRVIICLNDGSDSSTITPYIKFKNCPVICNCEKIIFFRFVLSFIENASDSIQTKIKSITGIFDTICKCNLIYNPEESKNLFPYDWGMSRKHERIKELLKKKKTVSVYSLAIIRIKYCIHGPDYNRKCVGSTDKKSDCFHNCDSTNKFIVLTNSDLNDINATYQMINELSY